MEKQSKKNLLISVLIVLVICLVGYIICDKFLINKTLENNNKESNNKEKVNSNNEGIKNIDINNNDDVNKLYNLIPDYNHANSLDGYSAYSADVNHATNYTNTIEGIIIKAVYDSGAKSNWDNGASCEELINNGAWRENRDCNSEYGQPYYKIDINKKTISNEVKKIIGVDNEKKFEYKTIDNYTLLCSYKNDEYYCYDVEGGWTGPSVIREIKNVEKQDEDIIIYDKYAFTFYYSIAEYEEDYGTAPTYKHTFKKDSEGNYYWYSTEIYEDGTVDNNTDTYTKLDNNDATVQKLYKAFTSGKILKSLIDNSKNTVELNDLSYEDYEVIAFSATDLKGTKASCSKYNLDYSQDRTINKNGDCCYISELEYSNYTTEYTREEVERIIKNYLGTTAAFNYFTRTTTNSSIEQGDKTLNYSASNQTYYCNNYASSSMQEYSAKLDSAYKNDKEIIINIYVTNDYDETEKYNLKYTFTYNTSTNSYIFNKLEKTKLS